MAKRAQDEKTGSGTAAEANKAGQGQNELPLVEAPSVSPAKHDATADAVMMETPASVVAPAEQPNLSSAETASNAPTAAHATAASLPWLQFKLRPRHRRYAMLASSVAIAATLGAVIGVAASGGFYRPTHANVAETEAGKAAQQSIARLSTEISSLKTSFEAANNSAHAQFAKIAERLSREGAEITGTIKPPQTVAPAPQASAPLPPSRPASGAEAPQRPAIVTDWTIRETRDGFVYVQGRGDVYQVVPGAPLPGLGRVEQIKRQDGRWVVVTPKGIIVSMRDRRYFEQF